MAHDYKHPPAPDDMTPCPECRAVGGAGGYIRVRGVMTDKEYNDKRCNKCGHIWTVGDSLELPFGRPAKQTPIKPRTPTTPAESDPEAATEPPDYDFGDGWEPDDPDSIIPF